MEKPDPIARGAGQRSPARVMRARLRISFSAQFLTMLHGLLRGCAIMKCSTGRRHDYEEA